MEKTELKHWTNGHHIRGNSFNTFAFQFKNIGFLLCIQLREKRYFNFEIFKLI